MTSPLKLAGAAYPVEPQASWTALRAKLDRWISAAAQDGAHILVLPEYAGLEAAMVDLKAPRSSIAAWCRASAEVAPVYANTCTEIAQHYGVWLLTGSMPAQEDGRLVNRAWLCAPDGTRASVDKQVLTPWERAQTPLTPGQPLQAFQTTHGRIGVLICYDSEFPCLAEALAPDILLVPSCTETLAGQTRVRNAARARALESQCVVVHAPLVGPVPACPIIDLNAGRAAICAPPDHPFPDTGLLAQSAPDRPGWALAELPRDALALTRSTGAVRPLSDAPDAATRASRITVATLGQ